MENPLIYKKMAQIMADVPAIGKGQKNQQQGFMYRGIDDVMNDLHKLFADNGVFILPMVEEYNVDVKQTSKGGLMYRTHVKVRYRFVAEDGSSIETVNVGEAMDSGDKSMNKAMSIALKYSLMQMLLIPTKENKDPDDVTPEPTYPVNASQENTYPVTTEEWMNLQNEVDLAQSSEDLTAIRKKWSRIDKWQPFRNLLMEKYNQLNNGK